MSRISNAFINPGYKALIPYVTVGYPSIEDTVKTVQLLAENGCDIIELGIPFSDPLADGATIQGASYHAIHNGVTPGVCLDVARELCRKVSTPLVFMTYFNPVLNWGVRGFCAACARAGVSGLIIPDLPPEEGGETEKIAVKNGIDLIYLLSPASPQERIRLVCSRSRGFVYLVSVTGVTGTRSALPAGLDKFIGRVKRETRMPVCVGFGISTPSQAAEVARMADGVIVGSRIIQLMERGAASDAALRSFIRRLRSAVDKSAVAAGGFEPLTGGARRASL